MSDRGPTTIIAERKTGKLRMQTRNDNKANWFMALVKKPQNFIRFNNYFAYCKWLEKKNNAEMTKNIRFMENW